MATGKWKSGETKLTLGASRLTFDGCRVTKTNAHDFKAFSSPNYPPLATVGISTTVNWSLVQRPSRISPFSVQTDLKTSHVACLRVFPGIMPEMVRGVLRLDGLQGLILETFGSGNAPEDAELLEVLREGIERGIVIVSVTQCKLSGPVPPTYPTPNARFGGQAKLAVSVRCMPVGQLWQRLALCLASVCSAMRKVWPRANNLIRYDK